MDEQKYNELLTTVWNYHDQCDNHTLLLMVMRHLLMITEEIHPGSLEAYVERYEESLRRVDKWQELKEKKEKEGL